MSAAICFHLIDTDCNDTIFLSDDLIPSAGTESSRILKIVRSSSGVKMMVTLHFRRGPFPDVSGNLFNEPD